ncbi:YcfA-like protein [Bacteroidales bacterium Barb7]|nr:YcfA-like protein [Bacteroidales bacterium Barb7]
MKNSEYLRKLAADGWLFIRQAGSHRTYEKNGEKITVPFHNSKELGKGLHKALKKVVGF